MLLSRGGLGWAGLSSLSTTSPSIPSKAWGNGGSEPLSGMAGGTQLGTATGTLVLSRPETSLWRGIPRSAQARPLTRPGMCLKGLRQGKPAQGPGVSLWELCMPEGAGPAPTRQPAACGFFYF